MGAVFKPLPVQAGEGGDGGKEHRAMNECDERSAIYLLHIRTLIASSFIWTTAQHNNVRVVFVGAPQQRVLLPTYMLRTTAKSMVHCYYRNTWTKRTCAGAGKWIKNDGGCGVSNGAVQDFLPRPEMTRGAHFTSILKRRRMFLIYCIFPR